MSSGQPPRITRPGPLARVLRGAAVLPIRAYARWISPWTPATCRFRPTCSGYALEAIERHGVLRGSWLGMRRILRCHPYSDPGIDPVPGSHHERCTPAHARLRPGVLRALSPVSGDDVAAADSTIESQSP